MFLVTVCAFSQSKSDSAMKAAHHSKAKPAAVQTAPPAAPAPAAATAPMFAIIVSGDELTKLWTFIQQGDLYSDKGKAAYLEELLKKVHPLPSTTDTTGHR